MLSSMLRKAMCISSRRGSSESYYRELGDQDTLVRLSLKFSRNCHFIELIIHFIVTVSHNILIGLPCRVIHMPVDCVYMYIF